MSTHRRSEAELQADRTMIARLYVEGWSQQEIVDQMARLRPYALSLASVARDIQQIRDEWRAYRLWHMDDLIARELARLDHIEREAWAAWHDSRKEQKETIQNVKPDREKNNAPVPVGGMITTRPGVGSHHFLQVALDCVKERNKLLALYPVQKHDVTVRGGSIVGGGEQDISRLDDGDLRAEIARLEAMAGGQQAILDEVSPIIDYEDTQDTQDTQP
jgi:hypothetical protein